MPQKDPEAYRIYKREQMRQRRAQAKQPKTAADNLPAVLTGATSTQTKTPPAPANPPRDKNPLTAPPKIEKKSTLTESPIEASREVRASETASRTRELLDKKGWCMWKCDNLNCDIVIIVRDEKVQDFPQGFPVYFEEELKNLPDDAASLNFVHRIKKETMAQILPGFERLN